MTLNPPSHLVSPDELERAVRLMRNHPGARILNSRIEPHWLSGGRAFWYRRETAEGHDFLVVDAATGTKKPAFDHDDLALMVDEAGLGPARADALQVTDIRDDILTLALDGQDYRCDLASRSVARLDQRPDWLASPNGKRAVYEEGGNLWLIDLDTKAERPLTDDGQPLWGYGLPSDRFGQNKIMREREKVALPPVQTWWSPDGRRIVTARLDQRHLATYPYLETAPHDGSFRPKVHGVLLPLMGEEPARLDWWVIHVDTGERKKLPLPAERMIAANNGVDDLKVAWSADGRTLYAISGMTGLVGAEAFAIDLVSGEVRTMIEDRSTPGHPLVAGGYGSPVSRFIKDGKELLWWSERDGWGHLYRYDTATGTLLGRLTQGEWLVRDIVAFDEAREEVWFSAMGREPGNPYYRALYKIRTDGTDLRLMTPEPGDHRIIDPTGSELVFDAAGPTAVVAPDFEHYVYDVSTPMEPTRTFLRRRDGGLVAEVERSDAGALFAAGYRPPQAFSCLAGDGESRLHGLVYRPSNHDPERRYPVIDVEYGNPAVAITPRSFAHAATFSGTAATPAALAELGFIVIVVDARGTPYRGRAFSRPPRDYLETMGLDDHIAFIRAVAEEDPSLDLDRVGIAGQSFGGYTAVCGLLRYGSFFKVAVAGAPQLAYHNMAAEEILTESRGAPDYGGGETRRPRDDQVPENFATLDLARLLGRLTGHLLIVAGELDENVYPGTVMQFAATAMREDRNVEFIWMPGQAHDALYTRYALRRTLEFLTRHLQGRLLPDDLPVLPDPRRAKMRISY